MSSQQIHGGRDGGGGGSGGGRPKEGDENGSVTKERTRMESLTKSRMDDLLSAEIGKHDYDWLLTPPGTPLCSYSETGGGSQTFKAVPKSKSNARSVSTGKASRLSVAQTERDNSGKSCRSNSTSRSSISNAYSSSTYLSSSSKTAILNTSTASVTSKPSFPGHRSPASSTARAPSSPSRSSTPTKTRPPSSTSSADKPRPPQNSRPCTPTVRPLAPSAAANSSSNGAAARSTSRPSTPSRRAPVAGLSPALTRSNSVGHAPAARPGSPAPRARAQAQGSPDRQFEAPSNAKTRPRERTVSAGRQRPGSPSTGRANSNPETVRRQSSSPVVTRGRLQENSSNARSKTAESKKPMAASESAIRRPIKPASSAEKSISKKPTDAKQNAGGIRGTSLFPQSIRAKGRSGRSSELPVPASDKVDDDSSHGIISRGCNGSANEHTLLKDDSKNTSWMHGIDGKCDRSPLFDYRLGSLPEPYGLL